MAFILLSSPYYQARLSLNTRSFRMKHFLKQLMVMIFIFTSQSTSIYAMGARRPVITIPIPPSTQPVNEAEAILAIKNIVKNSACLKYSWKNRGRAPAGYVKGVSLSFTRSLCRSKGLDNQSLLKVDSILRSPLGPSSKDALTHYQSSLTTNGFNIYTPSDESLRAVYLLGLGLGMRESSGRYCTGWDSSAGANRPSQSAEAGVFQTSFDSMSASPELNKLYSEYKKFSQSRCFLETFKEGTKCSQSSNLGSGAGLEFQIFNKNCPAFATEYAMVMLRVRRNHYGPINRHEAEMIPACNDLLKTIQDYIDRDPQTVCKDVF